MIDRENFDYIKNIVGIKKEYDITSLYDILTVIKNNPEKTPSILIDKTQSLSNLQKITMVLLDLLMTMIL